MSYVVLDGDYDSVKAVALYADKELADTHADWIGGWVTELTISSELPAEVGDPVEVKRREEKRKEAEINSAQHEEKQRRLAEAYMQSVADMLADERSAMQGTSVKENV